VIDVHFSDLRTVPVGLPERSVFFTLVLSFAVASGWSERLRVVLQEHELRVKRSKWSGKAFWP